MAGPIGAGGLIIIQEIPIIGVSFFSAPGRAHPLGSESLLQARQGELLADGKGVHREVESEGSPKQSTALTNRNRIRGMTAG